ncbi:E3 SUMO-protein ligase MMS21 [Ziziphus jujuba]|uniref:E3 SUMO-protein ligase MMS21 n=1 Tax=Ziziphus jujuba TaxID=326968 RepID=A0A6P4BJ60_ZIZJJ|nr:E3 SUMO-protein ligase MMS21 [Ziziphus jujuba]
MASSSASRRDGITGRIRNSASTLYSDSQSLIADIRKACSMMKEVAVDLERDNQSEMVKELENAVVELLDTYNNCMHFSSAIQSVGEKYQPEQELTDFKKLIEDEITKLKANSPSVPQNNPLIRQFKEAVWNVHHTGQLMPGDEQEDIVMTSTQCNLLNITCPLTGKPVTELADPVRSVGCKHVYDRKAILQYIRSKNSRGQCPVAGCPKILQEENVVCDTLLPIDIAEMRTMTRQTARTDVIEDFTEVDEEDSE